MNCRPTTRYPGRWTCETCGADLGDGTAPYLVALCPGPRRLHPEDYGDLVDEPDDADYDRGIADAVAALEPLLAEALADPARVNWREHSMAEIESAKAAAAALTRARDAVAALKRGDA